MWMKGDKEMTMMTSRERKGDLITFGWLGDFR